MKNIVLFASGSGSNAENIILHFRGNDSVRVTAVFCNNPNAGVIQKAENLGVPVVLFSKPELSEKIVLHKLEAFRPDLIVLAGFLLKFPDNIIEVYPNKIINIHPALLPKYGGKGMYGMNVHNAVLENKDIETGISIHYVNEHYDEGRIIAQHKIVIDDCVSAEAIANKIHQLEKEYFPKVIEQLLSSN
ncbi:phosphoribosylglycinamide formyltransferase [Flavobacterium sp. 3HN19-14]|uniref:phosphoribosylglycinamide formyltransferase n=1 Tax=Flavobacterium sp. 3HN19-14 TaxID=3448133 RepID=UPI003EE1DF4C